MAAHQYAHLFHRQGPSSSWNPRILRRTFCSSSTEKQQSGSRIKIKPREIQRSNALYHVKFKTFGPCKLGISRYPDFEYNADGGSGSGTAETGLENSEVSIEFDVESLFIPPLSSTTTKFLGLPLPPFLKIDIVPEQLQGTIDPQSGKVALKFRSKFCFSGGGIYKPPPLLVATTLTSEKSSGNIREGEGKRLDDEGNCKLVGVATVEPIDDSFLNAFLSLPTECIAVLNTGITFSAVATDEAATRAKN